MALVIFYLIVIISQVDNNLEAGKLTIPTLTYTGNVIQTGDIFTNEQVITGTLQTDTPTVARDAFLKQINIEGGNITNVVTNSDMIFPIRNWKNTHSK